MAVSCFMMGFLWNPSTNNATVKILVIMESVTQEREQNKHLLIHHMWQCNNFVKKHDGTPSWTGTSTADSKGENIHSRIS